MANSGQFQKIYLNSEKEVRDRFQVEFNKDERSLFTEMQIWLEQCKDATALKQWAFYGWLTISNQREANDYLKEKLLINNKNNLRNGIVVKTEIENKFQQLALKIGGNL